MEDLFTSFLQETPIFLSMQASDHKHENLLACHKFYYLWASGESVNTQLLQHLCVFLAL